MNGVSKNFEEMILAQLFCNLDYFGRVFHHLKEDYFTKGKWRVTFKLFNGFVATYQNPPSKQALVILFDKLKFNISDDEVSSLKQFVINLSEDKEPNLEWLVKESERFCQNAALDNGLNEAIQIREGEDKQKRTKEAIPDILKDSLSVSFDNSIGHNYFRDAKERWDIYHSPQAHIPFDLDYLNRITRGGLISKTINIVTGGCVHPDTLVRIKIETDGEGVERIYKIQKILEDRPVQVYSPDGWVPVVEFVDKGEWDEYFLSTENGFIVRSNEDHLYQTTYGWLKAKDIHMLSESKGGINVNTIKGWSKATVIRTGNKIPIVDIRVDHPNHRYWTAGVESHNTGVGKSTFLAHCAANHLTDGLNVLYITLEMDEKIGINEKIDANLLNIPVNKLCETPWDIYERQMKRLRENTVGNLVVKEFSSGTVNANHFRRLYNELKMKEKFTPNIIYLDYLNLCSSARFKYTTNSFNSYHYIKAVTEEIKGLATELDLPIMTAAQLNREGSESSDPTKELIGDSFGIPMTADLMLALISTDELESLQQMRIKQLKNRYNSATDPRSFLVGIDRSKMKFYNVDNSEQIIIDQLKGNGNGNGKNPKKETFDTKKAKQGFEEVVAEL
jgi:hypothetical protein